MLRSFVELRGVDPGFDSENVLIADIGLPGGNIAAWDPANPPADASEWRLAYARMAMPGYFEAMSIPLREGRDVRASDAGERCGRTCRHGDQ